MRAASSISGSGKTPSGWQASGSAAWVQPLAHWMNSSSGKISPVMATIPRPRKRSPTTAEKLRRGVSSATWRKAMALATASQG